MLKMGSEPQSTDSTHDLLRYVHSPQLPDLIEQLGISLFVSTYQAGKIMVVRTRDGRLSTLLRHFDQVMGMALAPGRLAHGIKFGCCTMRPILLRNLNRWDLMTRAMSHDLRM